MIRILKYEKALGSAKCQTGVGVGGYVAVVINPRRQIPRSSTEYEERREKRSGGGEGRGKKMFLLQIQWNCDVKIPRKKCREKMKYLI